MCAIVTNQLNMRTEQNKTEGLFPYKHIIYKYM